MPEMMVEFIEACDEELAFLVRDYGFTACEPARHAHECTVAYRKPSCTIIRANYEIGVSPWLTVVYSPAGQKGKTVSKGLHQLARRKVKGWKAPKMGERDRGQEMRRVLASYRELLEHHFPELLKGLPPELPESEGPTGSKSQTRSPARELSNRQAGFLRLLGGGVLFAAVWTYVYSKGGFGDTRGGTYYIIGMGAPGALAIIGLVEVVTNKSFREFSARWDALPGWKRGVFGVVVVLAAAVAVFGPLFLYLWIRDG